MDVGLGIAGLLCVLLGLGHETLGLVWVLPRLDNERLPRTPFGPPSMTLAMVRVTWHVVTIFALGLGVLLVTLAWSATVDPKTLLLRCFAVMWLAATAMAFWVVARDVRGLLRSFRMPVPLVWIAVAVLLWNAST